MEELLAGTKLAELMAHAGTISEWGKTGARTERTLEEIAAGYGERLKQVNPK
ncbi:MAG: hypothetical protein LBK27_02395 [Treponema sp.]|nr:hypothetical protein [Treponema sp.]